MLYYKISFLLGAVMSFIIATAILFRGGDSSLNKRFSALVISGAVWSLGFYFLISSQAKESALFWRWFMESGSILLPAFWLHFVFSFLEIKSEKSKIIILGAYSLSFLIWILNLVDFLYIPGIFESAMVEINGFKYYAIAGLGYYLFFTYFSLVTAYSLLVLYKSIKNSDDFKATQIKYILVSAAIGFTGGGMTFLQTIGIPIPPYGVIFFAFYPTVIAYAILKHHLFNLKLILVELAILLLNMFLLFNVFTSHATIDFVLNISVSLFVFIFSIILMRGIYKDIRDRERIEGLAKEMAVTNEKLHILEQQKTEFVSIASHQLRTPLTVIKGYASMILEGTFGTIATPVHDAMDKLYKSSERIVALVEDLLTVSRLEQGRGALHFETVDLVRVIQMVTMEMDEDIKRSNLDFSFTVEEGGEFPVAIDEKKFKQVVKHILDNAIEYTNAPGRVRIAINEDNIADKIRLTVSDTGVGMTAEQIQSIFERFNLKIKEQTTNDGQQTTGEGERKKEGKFLWPSHESADSKLKVESGIQESKSEEPETEAPNQRTPGIGLYIAQEIIEAHHGTLHIQSAGMNEGTTVIVELPRGN